MGGILPRRSLSVEPRRWPVAAGSIEEYVKGLGDWRGEVVATVDGLVRKAAPEANASIKWAQPVYEQNGPFAYIKAFGSTVNFGFWRGTELTDPDGRLEGSGDRMGHVKVASAEDIDQERFSGWVREAVALNAEKGDPTKGR